MLALFNTVTLVEMPDSTTARYRFIGLDNCVWRIQMNKCSSTFQVLIDLRDGNRGLESSLSLVKVEVMSLYAFLDIRQTSFFGSDNLLSLVCFAALIN